MEIVKADLLPVFAPESDGDLVLGSGIDTEINDTVLSFVPVKPKPLLRVLSGVVVRVRLAPTTSVAAELFVQLVQVYNQGEA